MFRKSFIFGLALALGGAMGPLAAQENPPAPAPAAAQSQVASNHPVEQIILGETPDAALHAPAQPDGPFVVAGGGLKHLESAEFDHRVIAAKGHLLDQPLLDGIIKALLIYIRQNGLPSAEIRIPTQDFADGRLRLVVVAAPAPEGPPLEQILLADSVDAAANLAPVPNGHFVVATGSLKSFESDELDRRLIAVKGRPLTTQILQGIEEVLILYARQHGYPVVDIGTPTQKLADGRLRLAILPGKFRQIKFLGNRWFGESQLMGDLHVTQGSVFSMPDLDRALTWTNDSNPFRRVQAHIEAVPNSNEADLIVGVQERFPLRVVAGLDDAGNDALGNYHYTLAATYANLWNLDHQLTYEYITTNHGQYFQGHVLNYRAPLPWHHYLQFSANYMHAKPILAGGYFTQDAVNSEASLRYTVPFGRSDQAGELFAGFDFKRSNNNLQYGGETVLPGATDVFEFTLGISKIFRDKRGAWLFGVTSNLSPGNFNDRNTSTAYQVVRGGARAGYAYADFTAQRGLSISHGWDLNSRATIQVTDGNLLGSEQLSIGGSSTVRGFNENILAGDEGFVLGNDLLAPVIHTPVSLRGKKFVPVETRFLAFYDAGQVRNKHAVVGDPIFVPLASSGVGVRVNWATNFSLTFDYGWQITRLPYPHDDHGRGHLKVTLAY